MIASRSDKPEKRGGRGKYYALIAGVLLAIYCGLWWVVRAQLITQMQARGFVWDRLEVSGFPTNVALRFIGVRQQSSFGTWQMREMRGNVYTHNPLQFFFEFAHPHIIELPQSQIRLNQGQSALQLQLGFSGLQSLNVDFERPNIMWRRGETTTYIGADKAGFSIEPPQGDAHQHMIGLHWRNLKINQGVPIERFVLSALAHSDILTSADRLAVLATQPLNITRLEFARKDLAVRASGKIGVDAENYLLGKLNLVIVNLTAFVDILTEFGVIQREQQAGIIGVGEMAAAFSGETIDRITLPLHFQDGQTQIGPLPIAAAPNLARLAARADDQNQADPPPALPR